MPLADVSRGVARGIQCFGKGDHLGERCDRVGGGIIFCASTGGGSGPPDAHHPVPRRILPAEQTRPAGRAYRRGGVGVGEQHPLRRQPIDPRGVVVPAAHAAQVLPAQVVDVDQQDVRAIRLLRCSKRSPARQQARRDTRRRRSPGVLEEPSAGQGRGVRWVHGVGSSPAKCRTRHSSRCLNWRASRRCPHTVISASAGTASARPAAGGAGTTRSRSGT